MQDIYLVNKNIRRIIREKGLAANKVARAAGISEPVLSNIVRCKRKVYADEVVDLAAALRTSIAELFREPERKKRMQNLQTMGAVLHANSRRTFYEGGLRIMHETRTLGSS